MESKRAQWLIFFAIWLTVGVLLGIALKAQFRLHTAELPSTRLPELARAYVQEKRTVQAMETKIRELLQKTTELENALASGTKQTKVLNDSLQAAKMLAGLVEVEGPGIELILRDSERQPPPGSAESLLRDLYIIHDYDLLRVVNELRQAGAEAVAINGQRLVASSAIRCVGPVIYVNDIKMASPFVIHAIGDPNTLIGALKTPGGVLSDIMDADPKMVEMHAREKVRIPAYTGSTQFRFAEPVPSKEVTK
ncbi:MAG: DUF881 domain-containing protein [Fimbriimonadales bacterium]|nr:DUF881 domain-containing protein [Fimbriimonadales bacterium]